MKRAFILSMAMGPCLLNAQTGTPDGTFNGNGILTVDINPGSNDIAWNMAFQPDGKAVVAGGVGVTNKDFALVRINPDGSLDAGFGGDGKVTTDLGSMDDNARAVAVQADGKIVAVGHVKIGNNKDFALVRYNPDGSLDNSFGGDGIVTKDLYEDDLALGMTIQPDGKILACGSSDDGIGARFSVARFNTDGSPDLGFGGGTGHAFAYFPPENNATAWNLALQPDGMIVLAGYANDGTYQDMAVARFDADGVLDPAFDGDGMVTIPIGPAHDIAHAIALQADGKIVLAGYAEDGLGGEQFAAARLNPDGSLDLGFDADGIALISIEGHDQAHGLVVQPDGLIVLGGYAHTGVQRVFASARLGADGVLDPTYDGDGRMSMPVGTQDDRCYGLALAPNGNIGMVGYSDGNNAADFAVVMLLSGLNLGLGNPAAPGNSLLIYPDPAGERATLGFTFAEAARSDCSLRDAQGRMVRTFFRSRSFPAGKHQVELDLSGLAPGAYLMDLDGRIIRLEVGPAH